MVTFRNKGFSLTEIILAILIVIVAMLPVFDMVSGASKTVASVEEETVAFSLASEVMEWMRALSHEDLKYRLTQLAIFPEGSLKDYKNRTVFLEEPVLSYEIGDQKIVYEPERQFRIFQRKTTIYKESPTNRSIKIEVIVKWKARMDRSKEGQEHEVKLEYLSFPL